MSKRIALIDGYGFVFRAYHSLPPLTRGDGTPVGAVYGFTNMLIKLIASLDVRHVAVVFDSGSKTFRNDIFPKYKANRPPCPEDLKPQFPLVRSAAESLNLHILEKIGFEADDIIATIAKKSAAEGYEVLIVSSDKDLMQLVDEKISMYDAMKNRFIKSAEVKEKFFVEPNQVLEVLSLMGDSSDNVPGVRGIGPKTAGELIQKYGTLENLYQHLDEIKQEKRRQLLIDGSENAKLSKQLIALKEDVELGISIDDLAIKSLDPHKLISFLEEQGFRALVARVKKEFSIEETATKQNITTHVEVKTQNYNEVKNSEITSLETIDKLAKEAALNGFATIDFQNNFLTISTAKSGESASEIFYFKPKETEITNHGDDLFSFNNKLPQSAFGLDALNKILLDDSIKKIFFDAKAFLKITKVKSFADVSLINHLLNSAIKHDLRELININLDYNLEERGFNQMFDELKKEKPSEIINDEEKKIEFFCFKNFAIHQLYKILLPKIFELKLSNAYLNYELPLLEVLAQIENNGIKIDVEKLRALSQEFGKKIADLSAEIFALAGSEFNIASSKQLSEILFDRLGLTSSKKSKKTGALSTGVSVLEELEEEGHLIARKILEFRKYSKLKNTYTDALPEEINSKTGRVHTNLSSISTVTGRLSSSNPNLQNIPIKSVDGQKIREAFVAQKNHLLISADYSQIELRVIAHAAKIENLILAFKEGKDIHRITASQVFKIPENEIDDATRSKAKAINFGIVYGISAFGLARQLDIPRTEAAIYIKSYFEAYPGIESFMKYYIDFAKQNGFVETISGRKCFIPEINNKNPMIRQEAERLAINAPIQGTAADIIKKAMINLSKKFREKNLRSKMILQIHDELIVEAPEDEVEIATKILKEEMENAFSLSVPLKVDVKVGKSWM